MHDEEKQKNLERAETLLSEQNFVAAVIAGAVAMLLAAVAYGMTVERWPFSSGFAAVGIGIVIGATMQFLGRGITTKFAMVAAAYTIVGCVLGNLFVNVVRLAQVTATSPTHAIKNTSLPELAEWLVSDMTFIRLVFWFVAVWFAVFLVKRPLSRADRLAIGLLEMKG